MATLTVWKFDTADGAEAAERTLGELEKQSLITVHDVARVSWPEGKKRPRTTQGFDLVGAGALGGSFWGLLFGVLFFVPLLGLALGAAVGALSGSLRDVGIDDRFIEDVRRKVTPGTSALFVLSSDAVQDKVRNAFAGQQPELISTNMSTAQEEALREAFAS